MYLSNEHVATANHSTLKSRLVTSLHLGLSEGYSPTPDAGISLEHIILFIKSRTTQCVSITVHTLRRAQRSIVELAGTDADELGLLICSGASVSTQWCYTSRNSDPRVSGTKSPHTGWASGGSLGPLWRRGFSRARSAVSTYKLGLGNRLFHLSKLF